MSEVIGEIKHIERSLNAMLWVLVIGGGLAALDNMEKPLLDFTVSSADREAER